MPYLPRTLPQGGYNATVIANTCNWMAWCGWPRGADFRNTNDCDLYDTVTRTAVPGDQREAVCVLYSGLPSGQDCFWNDQLVSAQKAMEDEYNREMLESYKPALSVLFNAFILAQVGLLLAATEG